MEFNKILGTITELHLYNILYEKAVWALEKLLLDAKCKSIVINTDTPSDNYQTLFTALQKHTHIESIGLTHNKLAGLDVQNLVDALLCKKCRAEPIIKEADTSIPQAEIIDNISDITFGHTTDNHSCIQDTHSHVCQGLMNRNCNLTKLDISFNVLEDQGAYHIANVLTNVSCNLAALNMCATSVGLQGTKFISTALIHPAN